jgi:hypothetical protein
MGGLGDPGRFFGGSWRSRPRENNLLMLHKRSQSCKPQYKLRRIGGRSRSNVPHLTSMSRMPRDHHVPLSRVPSTRIKACGPTWSLIRCPEHWIDRPNPKTPTLHAYLGNVDNVCEGLVGWYEYLDTSPERFSYPRHPGS